MKHIKPGKSSESQFFRFVSGLEKDTPMRVDKRNESLSPLQALAMMNNRLTVSMAKHFAAHAGSVRRAFQLALAREPKSDELSALEAYAKCDGLENDCRVILNLNEFSFVD